MRNLSYESVDRLNTLRRHFTEEPRRLDMTKWCIPEGYLQTSRDEHLWPACKTIGCISGIAQILFQGADPEDIFVEAERTSDPKLMTGRGAQALLLPDDPEMHQRLFYLMHWPEQFRYAYELLNANMWKFLVTIESTSEQDRRRAININIQQMIASVTDTRLGFFIKTDGTDDPKVDRHSAF